MRISVSEFRDMLEQHSSELRQAQDDYNTMADEKEAEIKELQAEIRRMELRLEVVKDAFEKFHNEAYQLLKIQRISSEDLSTANCQLDSIYTNILDELDGF